MRTPSSPPRSRSIRVTAQPICSAAGLRSRATSPCRPATISRRPSRPSRTIPTLTASWCGCCSRRETLRRPRRGRGGWASGGSQRPESPEVIAALARVALAEGDVEAVAAHARKLLALAANLEPSDGASGDREDERRDVSVALLRVAVPLLGAHRSADAQFALEGALRLYPDHPELSFYRALALVQRGRPHEGALAFEAVERSLRARGEDPPSPAFLGIEPDALLLDAQVQSALARGRAGEAPESTRRLRALFAEHPAEEGVALALLEAFDRAGKAAEAEQVLAASVRAHPEAGARPPPPPGAPGRAGGGGKGPPPLRQKVALPPQHPRAPGYIWFNFMGGREAPP